MCAVMWGLYIDYISGAVRHICEVWQKYCSGTYISSVKFRYTHALGHITDYIGLYEVYILT